MSSSAFQSVSTKPNAKRTLGRVFFLDLSGGRVISANPDGSDDKTIVSDGRRLPDGIVVDVAGGHIYWTNMGNPSSLMEGIGLSLDPQNGRMFLTDLAGSVTAQTSTDRTKRLFSLPKGT